MTSISSSVGGLSKTSSTLVPSVASAVGSPFGTSAAGSPTVSVKSSFSFQLFADKFLFLHDRNFWLKMISWIELEYFAAGFLR